MVHRRLLLAVVFGIGLALGPGCNKSESIARYRVDKPPAMDASQANPRGGDPHADLNIGRAVDPAQSPPGEPKDRTLGAIVPHGDQGWFFKLTGPKDAVQARFDEFTAFVRSVRFSLQGTPQWKLPEGWQARAGNDIRYATLVIGSDDRPLEVSVTALPKSGDDASYALVNVNRWRGQLQLPPIDSKQLADDSTRIELDGAVATVVNLLGTATQGGMGSAPFMSGPRNGN